MKSGRQWLSFDADFFDNGFTGALMERFGPTGIVLFVAFLCACKRNHVQGQFRYRNEFEALEILGVADLSLTDPAGMPFTLDEFWTFTGRYKQTSRTLRGHTFYVSATGWEQWQNSKNTAYERERKRRWRAGNVRDNVPADTETERDTESDTRDASRKSNYKPEPPTYREWQPDVQSEDPIVSRDAVARLLRRSTEVDG